MANSYLFTSESVTEGHPDKVADHISDAVLDAMLAQDPTARVACETMVSTGFAVVAGEVTTAAKIDIPHIVRDTIKEIGYTSSDIGFDCNTCAVMVSLDRQSPDIAMGVSQQKPEEQGAGDQGLMFGFACNDTPELMPMPIQYAHQLTKKLADLRKSGKLAFLRPDGKSQVSVRYENNRPVAVTHIVVSTQHAPEVTHAALREAVIEEIVKKVIPSNLLAKDIVYHINPTGRFVLGGPLADCGLTGRKIIVDTYGGMGRHGGGAFSGKDPSKVDRSGAYLGRYIAKNIVASGVAERCEVQVAYAIGVAEPVSVMVNCFGTAKVDEYRLPAMVRELFPLKPAAIIKHLNLLRPIYKKTAGYGHFGRNEPEFSWEAADKAKDIQNYFN